MGIELTTFEILTLSEQDPLKQKYRAQQAAEAAEVRVDYQSPELIEMGGLAVFCAMNDAELAEAA